MAEPQAVQQQLRETAARFEKRFGRRPRFAAVAPGRVNLIGEHTDYNDGFVFPIAIERQTLIVGDRPAAGQPERRARIASTHAADTGEEPLAEFNVDSDLAPGDPAWADYVRGVVAGFLRLKGIDPGGFDATVSTTVPVGGGLSSSAAIEIATATVIEAMTGRRLDGVDKALLCQWAEHNFPKMPCGIMDQFISTMGQERHAMLLDCRSRTFRLIEMADPQVTLLIVNSNVEHELTQGEYASRRKQCEDAARALGVQALRDVDAAKLEQGRDKLAPLAFKRARHVVGEIQRTLEAADAMAAGDYHTFGRLMFDSHASLRDDFEVSCEELDVLVELASQKVGGGVYGSRMTGGGFGGCTVTLVRSDAVQDVARHIGARYQRQTGIEPTIFDTRPAEGARELRLPD